MIGYSTIHKNPKNKGIFAFLSLIFRVFHLYFFITIFFGQTCFPPVREFGYIYLRRVSLQIAPQSGDIGALFQSFDALPHHIVQFHTEHLAALADDVAVYACSERFGLELLFE